MRPVRGARRALRSCERLIEDIRRVLWISGRFGTARPIRAQHHFLRAGTWLVQGSEQIGRAVAYLKLATGLVAAAPSESAGAPEAILDTTRHLIAVSRTLFALSERLSATSRRLTEAAIVVGHGAPPPPPPRPAPPRRFLVRRPEPITMQRRERPPPSTQVDAPRRVSRGRAPPRADLPAPSTAVRLELRRFNYVI